MFSFKCIQCWYSSGELFVKTAKDAICCKTRITSVVTGLKQLFAFLKNCDLINTVLIEKKEALMLLKIMRKRSIANNLGINWKGLIVSVQKLLNSYTTS